MPGTLNLLIGPVGAGKTTYAQRKVARSAAVFLDLDAWMVRLYGGDPRPSEDVLHWYLERRARCQELLWDLSVSVLDCGTDVYLEIGLLGRAEREVFYDKAHAQDRPLRIHLLDAPRETRRMRVAARNERPGPYTQIVPTDFFEQASDAWEPPSEGERAAWNIIDV